MKVILELDQKYLDQFQALANQDNRSRKKFMEIVLMNFLVGNPPTLERQKKSKEPPKNISDEIDKVEDHTEMAQEEKETILDRILLLNQELANPPKNPIIGQSKWVAVRQRELKELQGKLNKE